MAQYPLDMGRKGGSSSSNALALQVDNEGKVKYDAIARRGHDENRIVHASFKDLIPLRQRADVGEISLERPSEEEVEEAKERTQKALQSLVDGTLAAQKPKNIKGTSRPEPTFVRYTPANQMGDNSKKQDRIMKIVQRQADPMEPPKHRIKKVPRGPPSPPPPVMHSPPRKLTAEDQEAWRIPPPVSNWKNPKGYTVPLDKRLAADGRGLQDVTINDKFAQFAEALHTADMLVRRCSNDNVCSSDWQRRRRRRRRSTSECLRRKQEKAGKQTDYLNGRATLAREVARQTAVLLAPHIHLAQSPAVLIATAGGERAQQTKTAASVRKYVPSVDVKLSAKCARRTWDTSVAFRLWHVSRTATSVKKWRWEWQSPRKARKRCTTHACSIKVLASRLASTRTKRTTSRCLLSVMHSIASTDRAWVTRTKRMGARHLSVYKGRRGLRDWEGHPRKASRGRTRRSSAVDLCNLSAIVGMILLGLRP